MESILIVFAIFDNGMEAELFPLSKYKDAGSQFERPGVLHLSLQDPKIREH